MSAARLTHANEAGRKAGFAAGKAEGFASGKAEGVAEETRRCEAIIMSPEAAGRSALARHLATKTSISVAQAIETLMAFPAATEAAAVEPSGSEFLRAMAPR